MRGAGECILLGKRNKNLPEDHAWTEESCNVFGKDKK